MNRLGHFGYVFLLGGQWLLAAGYPYPGWPMRAIGEAIWLTIGVRMGMSSIWLWCLIFLGIDLFGWIRAGL